MYEETFRGLKTSLLRHANNPGISWGVTGVVLNRLGLKAWPSSYDHIVIVRKNYNYVNNFLERIFFLFSYLQMTIRDLNYSQIHQYEGHVF